MPLGFRARIRQSAAAGTQTFNTSGTFTVPVGVQWISVQGVGAAGGAGGAGGLGFRV